MRSGVFLEDYRLIGDYFTNADYCGLGIRYSLYQTATAVAVSRNAELLIWFYNEASKL